jgi:hypothetical protein
MAIIAPHQQVEFEKGTELYKINEIRVENGVHIATIVFIKQRPSWKKNNSLTDSEIIQFSGYSSEDVLDQCNEWLKTVYGVDMRNPIL